MYTIYHNSLEEGHSYYSFNEQFISICKEHKESGRALAFAFILYDFENPQLSKVLKDKDYWLALHEISGKYLTVFSIHYKEVRRVRARFANARIGVMEMLTHVVTPLKPDESANEIISKYFDEDLKVSYPSILFFQVNENQVIDSILIELHEKSIEPVFKEVKDYISAAVGVLKNITPENYSNHQEMFNLIATKVGGLKGIKRIKRHLGTGKSILEFGLALAGLKG